MSNKYALVSERVWLVITIATLSYAVYMVIKFGTGEWTYFIMPFLAGTMFVLRRFLRKRFARHEK